MTVPRAATAIIDSAALDDTAGLLAADHDGRLRGAASAGALVRAVAMAVEEGAFERLRGNTVRSVVLVAPRGPARHAGVLLQALFGALSAVPLVHTAQTPRWVGALDVVLVAADDAGDPELAESVARAVRRGAEVVLAAPEEGLLAPAGAGRALLLPPRVRVPHGMGMLHFLAVGLAVLAALQVATTPNLAALADELDAEAERNQAGRELFANPAKSLALRCAGRRLVLAADDPASGALAEYVAASLLQHAGVVAAAVQLAEALAAQSHQRHRSESGPAVDPIFHDPEIDGPLPDLPMRVVLLGTTAEEGRLRARGAALPDHELAVATIESGALQEDASAELLLLAARCESAAVYLGLAA